MGVRSTYLNPEERSERIDPGFLHLVLGPRPESVITLAPDVKCSHGEIDPFCWSMLPSPPPSAATNPAKPVKEAGSVHARSAQRDGIGEPVEANNLW